MKFLPVKERNMTMLMRLPARRLSLKAYIEKSMIPDIIEHEGSEFLSSLFWGAQPFVCDLYNGVWEQYAQERPFNTSDFRIFDAESKKHEILYVEVPVLPGLEEICSCALAFASDISDCRRVNIRSYRIQRHRIDDGQVVFEAFDPNGRAGCTRSMPEAESNNAQNKLIDLIWRMAFEEEGSYDMGELENPEELDSFDEMVMKWYEADRAAEEAFLAEVNAKERDGEGK